MSVHPHACGGNVFFDLHRCAIFRFIPTRVGETVGKHQIFGLIQRFIPTRVGETLCFSSHTIPSHRFIPTRVGETHSHFLRSFFLSGSSPRVWGKLVPLLEIAIFSPVHPHACGGNLRETFFFRVLLLILLHPDQ